MGTHHERRFSGGDLLRLSATAIIALGLPLAMTGKSLADEPSKTELWSVHGQSTVVEQGTLSFRSPYRGDNSLDPGARGRETFDATLYAGVRPWPGAELWVNPEIDQGFGLSGTLGVAGFPSGEAYKVGKRAPYLRLQRAFVRQTIDLGGDSEAVPADINQLAGRQTTDRLVITVGKIGVPDIFDANTYAHDPRHDFLNWSIADTGSFDYAADAWGYTVGAAGEWYQGPWTLRLGVFDLSDIPNSATLDGRFGQFQTDAEVERRYQVAGLAGAIKLTAFLTRGRMGRFDDAVALAATTRAPADIAAVRQYRDRTGVSLGLQQQLSPDLGGFLRAGLADGSLEPYEFADIDRTVAVGLSLNGKRWSRPDDTIALAGVINGVSSAHQRYLDAGGLGILVGDGRLPHPGPEGIIESYYDAALAKGVHVTLDYQFVDNPAYNRDRGPVSIFAVRLHGQF
jgi:high affinity Mn2+ porin